MVVLIYYLELCSCFIAGQIRFHGAMILLAKLRIVREHLFYVIFIL